MKKSFFERLSENANLNSKLISENEDDFSDSDYEFFKDYEYAPELKKDPEKLREFLKNRRKNKKSSESLTEYLEKMATGNKRKGSTLFKDNEEKEEQDKKLSPSLKDYQKKTDEIHAKKFADRHESAFQKELEKIEKENKKSAKVKIKKSELKKMVIYSEIFSKPKAKR